MRLSMVSSNIIHQLLEEDTSIIYEPHGSLFDHILCSCIKDINYYIFSQDIYNMPDNCLILPESNLDIYSYDICLYNDILSMIQHMRKPRDAFLYANPLVFQHYKKPERIKKEDVLIMKQETKYADQIFFDFDIMSSWGYHEGQLIQYGVPLDVFYNKNSEKNTDILILSRDAHRVQTISDEFVANNIKYEIISDFKTLKMDELNEKFNQSKMVLDLESNTINQLCALACGCEVVVLSHHIHRGLSQWITMKNSIDSLIDYCISQRNSHPQKNYDQLVKYLDNNFNYDTFKLELTKIMQSNKRKALIL